MINPGETIYFADLLAAMGQTGIGSVDVTAANGTTAPVFIGPGLQRRGRGRHDGLYGEREKSERHHSGSARMSFWSLPSIRPHSASTLEFGPSPREPRSRSPSATRRAPSERLSLCPYGPNFFQQFAASSFLGGLAPNASDTITVFVKNGGLVLYATTADNTNQ